jgi:hypothetical protein
MGRKILPYERAEWLSAVVCKPNSKRRREYSYKIVTKTRRSIDIDKGY